MALLLDTVSLPKIEAMKASMLIERANGKEGTGCLGATSRCGVGGRSPRGFSSSATAPKQPKRRYGERQAKLRHETWNVQQHIKASGT
jgi:hypothetical protein